MRWEPAPSAAEVFATRDRKLFRRHGEIIGENCRSMGFNVDFAPVLDLAFEASRSVMGSRAVSANPREVVVYAREFLAGLVAAKVLGCGKHFPGLGEGNLDSHHELPMIEKSMKRLWAEDLLPYRTLRRQLPLVMVSHAAYPHGHTRRRLPPRSRRSGSPTCCARESATEIRLCQTIWRWAACCRRRRWERRLLSLFVLAEIYAWYAIARIT